MRNRRLGKKAQGSINLRNEAAERECQIRLDGCQTYPAVLCHLRQVDISGGGMKAPDLLGAWGCASCHNKVDVTERGNMQTQFDFMQAIFRTQNILIKEGKVTW